MFCTCELRPRVTLTRCTNRSQVESTWDLCLEQGTQGLGYVCEFIGNIADGPTTKNIRNDTGCNDTVFRERLSGPSCSSSRSGGPHSTSGTWVGKNTCTRDIFGWKRRRDEGQLVVVKIRTERNPADLLTKPLPFNRTRKLCELAGAEYDQDSMAREPSEFNGCLRCSTWNGAVHPGTKLSVLQYAVPQNLRKACKNGSRCVRRCATLDHVAEDSYTDPTMFRQCKASDPSLVQGIALEVELVSVLRVCVSLTFYQHCSCTPAHVVRTPAVAVNSALAHVSSKRVIHGIESQHSTIFRDTRATRVSHGQQDKDTSRSVQQD